jgi:hypothetical protein
MSTAPFATVTFAPQQAEAALVCGAGSNITFTAISGGRNADYKLSRVI